MYLASDFFFFILFFFFFFSYRLVSRILSCNVDVQLSRLFISRDSCKPIIIRPVYTWPLRGLVSRFWPTSCDIFNLAIVEDVPQVLTEEEHVLRIFLIFIFRCMFSAFCPACL